MKSDSGWDDFRWLSGRDLSKYRGKWIVIPTRRVVAADKDLERAIRKAKLPPEVPPFVHRVPKEEVYLVL